MIADIKEIKLNQFYSQVFIDHRSLRLPSSVLRRNAQLLQKFIHKPSYIHEIAHHNRIFRRGHWTGDIDIVGYHVLRRHNGHNTLLFLRFVS